MRTISENLASSRKYFSTGVTRPAEFRIEQLKRLKAAIGQHESDVLHALKADLHKPAAEAFVGEVAFTLEEIDFAIRHLRSWMRPSAVSTPWLYFRGRSRIYREPLGVVLIIGPWNYPFQLVMSPLVAAISAGNGALLKPSELSPNTSAIISRIVGETFPKEFISVYEGGVEVSTELLNERFDHIFFTGGGNVGRVVMTAAAKHLTPVTLELGGKSPCIVTNPTMIETTARRIAWGKFYNAGQTCVAPDYLLVEKSLKEPLLKKIGDELRGFFGEDPKQSGDYGRIISDRHYQRLVELTKKGKVALGGKTDASQRYIAPTVIDGVGFDDKVMQEEIFGPILPVIPFDRLDEAIGWVNARPKPLALYLFTTDKAIQEKIVSEISFGGGCINDTLIHLANPRLPFGGVGESGMGSYHGKYGFDTFSHHKSVVHRSLWPDLKQRYPPYPGINFFRKALELLG